MKSLLTSALFLMGLHSSNQHSEMHFDLADYRWENRVVLIFGADEFHPKYKEQKSRFTDLHKEIEDRDLRIVTILNEGISKVDDQVITNESAHQLREQLKISDNQFSIILIGKDGGEKIRSKEILSAEDVFSVIDKMPMRQREMRDGKNSHR